MTDAHDLDDYVRQAAALSPDRAALLADAGTRRDVRARIVGARADRPGPRRRVGPRARLAVAGLAVGLTVVAALFATRLGPAGPGSTPVAEPTPTPRSSPKGDLFGGAGALSCVEAYSEQTLPHRGIAFDGTVETIGEPWASGYAPVTFRVNRWFRGGRTDHVTIGMLPPGRISLYDDPPYQVGSRLLISGERIDAGPRPDDLVAWACGFSRWYDPAEAQVWARAFRSGPTVGPSDGPGSLVSSPTADGRPGLPVGLIAAAVVAMAAAGTWAGPRVRRRSGAAAGSGSSRRLRAVRGRQSLARLA
jgi:hypothetical protein